MDFVATVFVYSGPWRWVLAASERAGGQLSSSLERYHAAGLVVRGAPSAALWWVTVGGRVQPPPNKSFTGNETDDALFFFFSLCLFPAA